jgi:hypothetical protein
MIACVWPHRHHAWETISTLRFSQRMKAIVNTPIRNKLVTQDVISIKSQQQIDSLKKELALRDMIAGRETWLPTLTKAQQSNTIQQACNFAESIAKTKNNDDILDDYMEFQSLSQIRLTAETLKAIVWEACDQNQSKVTAIIEQFLRIQNVTRDHNNDPVDIPNQGFTDVDEMYETRLDNNPDVIYDNNNDNNNVTEVNSSPTKLQVSPSKQMLTFEEFKVLFLSLLSILALNNKFIRKQNMVIYYMNHMYMHVMNCKPSNTGIYIFVILNTFLIKLIRQKDIIGMINKLKSTIDTLSRQLSDFDDDDDGDDNDVNEESKGNITVTIEQAKADYRVAYSELQLCKQQITEMQSLKKRAMATLVQHFEKYQETGLLL